MAVQRPTGPPAMGNRLPVPWTPPKATVKGGTGLTNVNQIPGQGSSK